MKRWVDYLIIVLVGLVTHGLLLLNDGVYWDGWILYFKLVKGTSLAQWFVEAGRPFEFCFHWIMGHFPGFIFEYKLVSFLSIIFIAVLIYEICRKFKQVSRTESLLISVIVLTYPVLHVGVEMTITAYLFFYMLFCLAAFLVFKSKETTGIIHYVWRVLSLIIFFVSFSLYSLLVFFFGFILLLMLYERHYRGFSLRQIVTLFLPRHLDYISLPFLFWILNKRFFPLSKFYAEFSDKLLNFNLSSIMSCFIGFLKYSFYVLLEGFGQLFAHPVLMLIILLLTYWIYNAFRINELRWFGSKIRSRYFIIIGVVMFVAGVFAYVTVGAFPKMYNWDSRHAVLLGLPVALVLVGLFRIVFSRKGEYLSRLGFTVLITLIATFIISNINAYLFRQAAWIKNRSIIYHLSQKKCVKPISVFWIDQQVGLPGDEANYFYVWASIFTKSWGEESHIGFPGRFPPSSVNSIDYYSICLNRGYNYNSAALDPKGAQAILTVLPGPQAKDSFTMSMRYFKCRFFRPENMSDFLTGVTRLHIEISPREGPSVDGSREDIRLINREGWSPLAVACKKGTEMLKELLKKNGLFSNKRDARGNTPLHLAAGKGNDDIIKLLIGQKVAVNAANCYGDTPLFWAISNNHIDSVKLLIESGANVNQKNEYGWIPLHWSAANGYQEITDILIDKGAEIDARDNQGATPIFWAINASRDEVVDLLLRKGARVNLSDNQEWTPLHWAVNITSSAESKRIIQLLIDKGADVHAKDKLGQTPLFWVRNQGAAAIVELLVNKGADVNATNKWGFAVLTWAAENMDNELVEVLLSRGAKVSKIDHILKDEKFVTGREKNK